MRVVIVHNPGAGKNRHEADSLVELARRAQHEPKYFPSTDESWKAAASEFGELVVAAGGDGTVARVAKGLAGGAVPLAVLPLGTANNISRALGQAGRSVESLIAGWTGGVRRPFDLGFARGPWGAVWFLESVGVGLMADSMNHIKEGSTSLPRGPENIDSRLHAARSVFARLLGRMEATHISVEIDGVDRSGDYVLAEVLNFGAAGPNLRLSPQASAWDGLLDVVLVEERHRGDLGDHLTKGGARKAPLPVHQASHVRMSCRPKCLHVDDELWHPPALQADAITMELTVSPRAVTVVVPAADR